MGRALTFAGNQPSRCIIHEYSGYRKKETKTECQSEHTVQEIDGVQEEMALFVRILARPLRIWNYWPQIRPKLDERDQRTSTSGDNRLIGSDEGGGVTGFAYT